MPILYKKQKTTANPLRYDPTRTGPLRRKFMAQIEAKFKELERRIYQFVAVKNPFGLTVNADFTWATLDTQLEMFKEWITGQMRDLFYPGDTESWWTQYIAQGWQQGAKNVYDRWRSPSSFLASAFNQPVSVAKVKLLASRVLTELQNVTTDMATKMIRELVDGLVEGKSPREVAKDITESVDGISKQRALTIARTETIRAHAEGQLDTLETLGMSQVGIAVEFSGSGVGVTKKGNPSPCVACSHLVGIVLTLQEARGIIPVHPNCMCSFIPANVGEDGKNQIRSFQGISTALQKALKASQPKARKGVKAKQSSWGGAKVKLDKARPTSIFNSNPEGHNQWTAGLVKKYPGLKLELEDHGDHYRLEHIGLTTRRKGLGTQVMKEITDKADKFNKRIRLTPDPTFGTPLHVLQSFYAKHGFISRNMPSGALERHPKPTVNVLSDYAEIKALTKTE